MLRTERAKLKVERSSFGPVMTIGAFLRALVFFSVGRRIVILLFAGGAGSFMRAVFIAVFRKPFRRKLRYYELFFVSFGFRFRGFFPASRHTDDHHKSKT